MFPVLLSAQWVLVESSAGPQLITVHGRLFVKRKVTFHSFRKGLLHYVLTAPVVPAYLLHRLLHCGRFSSTLTETADPGSFETS